MTIPDLKDQEAIRQWINDHTDVWLDDRGLDAVVVLMKHCLEMGVRYALRWSQSENSVNSSVVGAVTAVFGQDS